MKAFLSHSSKDKGFVEAVANLLKPGTYELDSLTFDKGALNSQAIIDALKRSDLFCLFLSSASVNSSYIDFETLLGIELYASGTISRFLVVCLDDTAFEKASSNVKFFNIVRRGLEEGATARLIQGHLVAASGRRSQEAHPFIGREDDLRELERQVTDHNRPHTKALFLSGNYGSGRRTIAQKFYGQQFPNVGKRPPLVDLEPFSGLEELYRKLLVTLRPAMTAKDAKTRIQAFTIASPEEKQRQIAGLINSLLPANEMVLIFDRGGVLTDEGRFTPELNDVISLLIDKPHPPAAIIAPRMIPQKLRRPENDISYVGVRSLKRDDAERLIRKLLRDRSIEIDDTSLQELVQLSDNHPFNIYQMIDEILSRGLTPFLASPRDFIDWKHRHSSDYLSRLELNQDEISILSLLKQLPELDFRAIVETLALDPASTSEAFLRLLNLHVVEANGDIFSVSPALQIAAERDRRLRLSTEKQAQAMKNLASSLVVRIEEGTAPIVLVDAAILSTLESGEVTSDFAAAFLLPSHHIWLAKRHYDRKRWRESMRFANDALKGAARLSSDGFVGASRYLCLAAARLGEIQIFDEGIRKLEFAAKTDWAKSNVAFLRGFNLRLKGNLPEAESYFREAYTLSPGNSHAAHELAEVCLARDNLEEAERYAREGLSHGPSNPYHIDTLISVLIRKHGRISKYQTEINELFDLLKNVGEEDGKSFYTTRKAEFEHLWGDNRLALTLIEDAIRQTPSIFEPRRLYAHIQLKEGNKTKAYEAIKVMEGMVNARNPTERRSNYRAYLKTFADYYVEISRFKDAKELYGDQSIFTDAERRSAIRDIEIAEGYEKERNTRG